MQPIVRRPTVIALFPPVTEKELKRDPSRLAPADQAIYGEWASATYHKSRKAGEIQETHFVARRSELRASGGHRHELDRAESQSAGQLSLQ
jgi:hypothetical protein